MYVIILANYSLKFDITFMLQKTTNVEMPLFISIFMLYVNLTGGYRLSVLLVSFKLSRILLVP